MSYVHLPKHGETHKSDSEPFAFFDKKIGLIPASEFCREFGYSMKTVYDWNYRPQQNNIPKNLIVKFRGKLFLRVDILKQLLPFTDAK